MEQTQANKTPRLLLATDRLSAGAVLLSDSGACERGTGGTGLSAGTTTNAERKTKARTRLGYPSRLRVSSRGTQAAAATPNRCLRRNYRTLRQNRTQVKLFVNRRLRPTCRAFLGGCPAALTCLPFNLSGGGGTAEHLGEHSKRPTRWNIRLPGGTV